MSRGLNKVMVIGNLGADPETKYLPSGVAVTKMSVAVTETWKDKQTGEAKERTEWINIEAWGKTAELCAEYLEKGKQVYVEGNLQTDSWEGEDGVKKYFTKVRAQEVKFLGGGGNRNQRAGDARDQDGKPPTGSNVPGPDDFDDDIPF